MTVDELNIPNRSVGVEADAERILAEVEDLDCVRGVGYYAPEECDTVYLRSDVQRTTEDPSRPLEDAVLESISLQTLEDYFDDDLTSTLRIFETKVVLYACAAEHRGVVVALDREPDVDYADLLTTLERVVDSGN